VLWRFTGSRILSETSEQPAQGFGATSFFLVAPYIAGRGRACASGRASPETSVVGVCLTAESLLICPWLVLAKRRVGAQLGSAVTRGAGTQNLVCAFLAAATLVGPVANTAAGIWWLDPLAGQFIAAACVLAGRPGVAKRAAARLARRLQRDHDRARVCSVLQWDVCWKQATSYCAATFGLPELSPPWLVGLA
jgi:divalent metal cation (Fe/Co/Zn/Cd) transporter